VRITCLETLRPAIQPNVVLVRLHTDDGLAGIGEAFFSAAVVEAYLHETVAPALVGLDDPAPEPVARILAPYAGYQGAGVEMRGNGAIDLALWDLLGKRAGLPVVDVLGGRVRPDIRIYNTCAGSGYVSQTSRQVAANWGRTRGRPYEDLHAFLTDPAGLARELVGEGIPGMKIWPFDEAAERTGGTDISHRELTEAVALVAQIRDAVGDAIDVMIELHGLWDRRAATVICDAVAPYRPYWIEDPLRPDAVDALGRLAADIDVPVAAGETCVGRRGFLPLLREGAIDVATMDVQWTGGLTEARKVAALADTYGVSIAPHDCTGPVSLAACAHLVLSQPNGLIQETVRAFLRTWYGELVTGLPVIRDGTISVSDAPGLGVELCDGLAAGPDVTRRVTALDSGPAGFRTPAGHSARDES
jgi:L-alanine-DL-glutamate epimerase-like enolase superfamily enzyme